MAYYLKDDLNRFWQQPNKALAAQWLTDWLHDAETSGIRLLQKFAKTLASRRQNLLAWYDYPISTGPLEAVNNKNPAPPPTSLRLSQPRLLPTQTLRITSVEVRDSRMSRLGTSG